jgi:hypothetical protein
MIKSVIPIIKLRRLGTSKEIKWREIILNMIK